MTLSSSTTTIFTASSPAPGPSLPSLTTPFFSFGFRQCVFPTLPAVDTFFDVVTIALILCFVFLSLLSLSFILHLRIKSRYSVKLQSFSSHWTARFLMVVLNVLWAVNELLRLPIFRRIYTIPFLPPFSLALQTQLCKLHLVMSFGLYEPGFLVALLYLVNISVTKRRPNNLWAIGLVGMTCLPLLVALSLAIFVLPGRFFYLAPVFTRYSVLLEDKNSGNQVAYCTYPLLGTVIFGVFGAIFALVLLVSCWKVVSLAINKRLRARVNTLALTVLSCLATQFVLMTMSVFLDPDHKLFYVFVFVNFVSVLVIGCMSQCVLVIKAVSDTLESESSLTRERRDTAIESE